MISLWEDEWWPETEMQSALKPYLDEVSEGLSVVVGRSSVELTRRGRSNSPMGNLVTEAMRSSFDADWAFSNTGGLRTDIPAGAVTVGDLMRLLPFGNGMVVAEMEGRMIREILERKGSRGSSGLYQSGITWTVDPYAEHGQRVLTATIGGEPLQADRLYKVVCSDYLMEGNSGFGLLTSIPSERTTYTQLLIRDAVQRYLQEHSPVAPRPDGRFKEQRGGEVASYLLGWDPQ
jgi:2',3'-cyclic-nucleotide 2'-phosphodiesterase (5'-nucleotidase family)